MTIHRPGRLLGRNPTKRLPQPRGLLLASALIGTVGVAPARAERLAFVLNSSDASVSLIDVDRMAEVRRVPVLREPHHMALTPDGRYLLIGDTAANEVIFLDPATGDVRRRLAMSDPYQLTFSPDGKWLTVAALARNQVDIYDAATLTLANRLAMPSMPSHINYAPDSSVAYVSLQGSDSLAAIEVRTGKLLWKSKVGPTPAGVLWHDGRLLVGIMGSDHVAVVDPTDGTVERSVRTGRGAHVLFVPPDRKAIYVSNRVDGTVTILDPVTLVPLRSIKIPGGPDDMVFAPDGRIWVSRRWAQAISVVDPATGQMQQIPVGRSPHGIWLNAAAQSPSG